MVEVLIASALLLVVALGILPMFMRSISDNFAGDEFSKASNHVRTRLEQFSNLPISDPLLDIPSGDEKLEFKEYWHIDDGVWKDGTPDPAEQVRWLRTTTVRQFSASDVDDDGLLNSPIPGGTAGATIKEIAVEVTSWNADEAGALGPGRRVTARLLKVF